MYHYRPKRFRKSTTIVINVIQQLVAEGEESPRALIIVEDKVKVLEMETLFENLGSETNLRVYGVHDKGDLENTIKLYFNRNRCFNWNAKSIEPKCLPQQVTTSID